MSTQVDLSLILSRLALPPDAQGILLERFAQTLDLARAGEAGVGLENLCDNLFEFEVNLSADDYRALVALCRKNGVGVDRLNLLDALLD